MSVFKDLGFINQGGVLTLHNCFKIDGLTSEDLINSVLPQILSADVDGIITVQGSSLPLIITQESDQQNWRKIDVKAHNLTSGIIINGQTLVVKLEENGYTVYEQILTNTRTINIQGTCDSLELTLYVN